MKILFSSFSPEEVQFNKFKSLGHEVIRYNWFSNKNEEFRLKTRHFQMYENFLNFAQEEKVDLIYFCDYLNVPEFLLGELKVRPEFTPKIIFMIQMREVNRSLMRANTIKELLDMPQIAKVMTFSMGLSNYSYPETLIKVGTNFSKIKNLGELFSEDPNFSITKKESRELFSIPKDAFVILWCGRWIYSKGIDIFVDAAKFIDKDIFIFAHKNPAESDFDDSLSEKLIKNHPNTKFIIKHFDNMKYVYSAVDAVICSHRKICEYSESGIPSMAALAKIPIVAPNFNYFKEIIHRYKIGITFEPENVIALASAINLVKYNYDFIIKDAQFKESIKGYINFEDIPKLVMENL